MRDVSLRVVYVARVHDPIELCAFDTATLTTLVRQLRASQASGDVAPLIEAIAGSRNAGPASRRKRAAERAARLQEAGALELLIRHEQLQADPRAFALDALATAPTEDTWDDVMAGIALMCRPEVLSFRDDRDYLDLAWWGGHRDCRWPDVDDPDWDQDEQARLEAEWAASTLRPILEGTTQLRVDDAVVPYFAHVQRPHPWHAEAGLVDAIRAMDELLARGAPPMATWKRSSRAAWYKSVTQGPLEPHVPELYAQSVVNVRRIIERALALYKKCLRRGWEVYIAGEL